MGRGQPRLGSFPPPGRLQASPRRVCSGCRETQAVNDDPHGTLRVLRFRPVHFVGRHDLGGLLQPYQHPWKLLKGFGEASTLVSAWRQIGFNDAAWANAPAPFLYTATATEPPFFNTGFLLTGTNVLVVHGIHFAIDSGNFGSASRNPPRALCGWRGRTATASPSCQSIRTAPRGSCPARIFWPLKFTRAIRPVPTSASRWS